MKYDVNRPIKADKSLPEGIADRLPDGIKNERERREFFMSQALLMAKRSCASDDVPVGCVIVRHDEIIAAACNEREKEKCALRHAEATAIERACRALQGWRLVACELYVTLEPCPMCAGAIASARVPVVIYGASDKKGGAMGGMFDLFKTEINHKPDVVSGVLEEECSALLSEFFGRKRKEKE